MANENRTMEVQIKASDKTQKGVKSAGKSFAGLAKNIVAVSAALGAAAIAKSTQIFIRQEQAVKQLEIRLKSTGGVAGFTAKELTKMAAGLQKVSVFGDEAVIEMQSLLLTFTQIRGEEFKGAQEAILNVATAMGTDLKSAAIQVGKALNDPKVGLTALTRSGITFSEVQKDLIKGFVESGEKAKAQQIILKELETQFGGASQATGLGGAVAQFNNALGDVAETFGKGATEAGKLNETLDRMTQQMQNPAFLSAINSLGEGLGFLASSWQAAAEAAGAFVGGSSRAEIAAAEAALRIAGTVKEIKFLTLPGVVPRLGGGDVGPIAGGPGVGQGVPSATEGIFRQQAAIGITGESELFSSGRFAGLSSAIGGVKGLTSSLATEVEAINNSYQERLEIIKTAEEQGLDTADLAFRTKQDFEKKLTSVTRREEEKKARIRESKLRNIQGFANNVFSAIAGFAEEGSREEFEANKKGATANAIINTAQGVTKAFGQGGFFGFIMAAAVAAAGIAQISKIQSQQFDSGGGGSSIIPPAAPDIIGQDQPITQPPSTTGSAADGGISYNITVQGNIVDQDAFARSLVQPLEQARLDGERANL